MNPLRLLVLIVSLPLLLGGCGEAPVAVQKAIEGVNAEEVEEREDIVYLKGSVDPPRVSYHGRSLVVYSDQCLVW